VNTGTAHQTKEARRVESASFLRGYARGALGAIRDCREDTERLLRKCGARQREPAGLPSSVRNCKGHRGVYQEPVAHWRME
jgi:predicted kinase